MCFLFCLSLHELIPSFFSFTSILSCTVLGNFTYFPGEIPACLLCSVTSYTHGQLDGQSWMLLLVLLVPFFSPHLAVSIYQPSVSVTRYFFGAKTSTKLHIFIFLKNINCSKRSQCTWKSKKQILTTLSTCPSSKVNSIKTFLRTDGTRALFGGSFLSNSNHSVLLDFLILPSTWRVIDLKHSQSWEFYLFTWAIWREL